MTDRLLLRHGHVLDVATGSYLEGTDVLCEDGKIVEVAVGSKATGGTRVIDAAGLVIMPGLIDAHVHVTAVSANLGGLSALGPSYVAAYAARTMSEMLARGFTTVRDAGGADHGLARAQREGLMAGPRLLYCGRALSQTGGHGDFRPHGRHEIDQLHNAGISRVVDGADPTRVAARDELRKGADFIKVMASGGVASPTDRIDSTQYSPSELEAAVQEAAAANRYVAAHAYTGAAVVRALKAGVRSIEHGNLLDDESLRLLIERRAYLVPTLVTYWALENEGPSHGLLPESREKVGAVLTAGLESLERAYSAGVSVAFGSDLLGGMHRHQLHEFRIRAHVVPLLSVIQSATCVAAELIGMRDAVGRVEPGFVADLLVLDGDPLAEVSALTDPVAHHRYVIQAGRVVVDRSR